MLNFIYANPTRLIFGAGQLIQLPTLLSRYSSILVLLDPAVERLHALRKQLTILLPQKQLLFYSKIPANSELSKIKQATEIARLARIDFILAIGGGSTIDAAKFISCAVNYPDHDLWQIMLLSGHSKVSNPIPMGSLVSYPSAGSEMNPYFVASNRQLERKIACYAPMIYPEFTILDPNLAASLSAEQLALGIADSFIHIVEQFVTLDEKATLQDLQAATLLSTLLEAAPQALKYNTPEILGNIMLASTLALNGLIECGITSDWTTHWISHELTAIYGLKHAEAVLVTLPAVWSFCQNQKHAQLLKYAQLVWNISPDWSDELQIKTALAKTWQFFRKLGLKLTLAEFGIFKLDQQRIIENIFDFSNGNNLGENLNLDRTKVQQILHLLESPFHAKEVNKTD